MTKSDGARLSPNEVEDLLKSGSEDGLLNWTLLDGKLHRSLVFSDFIEAFAFMSSLALVSEKRGHHPEWRNVYNRLDISLQTHDANGITLKDIEWAKECEALLQKRSAIQ